MPDGPSGTGHDTDDFVRFCCGDPDCPNDCERDTPPGPASASDRIWTPGQHDQHCAARQGGVCGRFDGCYPPGPASVSPAEPREALRTRRSFSDRELTRLQETGSVVVGHSMVDGIRLTAITASLLLLGIDPDDVVLHGTGADHIAVTVKPDA